MQTVAEEDGDARGDQWRRFTGRGKTAASGLWVSIHEKGNLSLNQAAYEALGQPAAVELLFDEHKQQVGLRPVSPGVAWAYPLRQQGRHAGTYLVAFTAFRKHHRIPVRSAQRFRAAMRRDVLAFDLDQPVADVGRTERARTPGQSS